MNEDVSDNKILRDLGELFPWSWAARVDAPSSDSRIRSVFRKKARPLLASEASVVRFAPVCHVCFPKTCLARIMC